MMRALVAANVENIAVAFCRDQSGLGAFVFKQRIRGNRRAVVDVLNGSWGDSVALAQLSNASNHPNRGILWSRWYFVDVGLLRVRVGVHDICECSTNIDSDEFHYCQVPFSSESIVRCLVIPAQAGIYFLSRASSSTPLRAKSRTNRLNVIPAQAGIHFPASLARYHSHSKVSYKSFQFGFSFSMRLIFHCRRHFFNCFSLSRAESIFSACS